MKEIEWKPEGFYGSVGSQVGNVHLRCQPFTNKKRRWRGSASTGIGEGIFSSRHRRNGKWRRSLSRAKEEAIQLAHEMLMDYKTCVNQDMKNFDL